MFKRGLRFAEILALIVISLALIYHDGAALDGSVSTTVNITAAGIFSIGFYTDQNVIYSTTVPFSNVDPAKSFVYPNGRAEDDGKSDTGIVCISNVGVPWYLKIQGAYSEGLPETGVKYYYSQPWDRNTGNQTGGSRTYPEEWRSLPTEPSTIYTSGLWDTVNTPYGTLSTFSFAVDPRGLDSDRAYTVSVTYTMTTGP